MHLQKKSILKSTTSKECLYIARGSRVSKKLAFALKEKKKIPKPMQNIYQKISQELERYHELSLSNTQNQPFMVKQRYEVISFHKWRTDMFPNIWPYSENCLFPPVSSGLQDITEIISSLLQNTQMFFTLLLGMEY